MKVLWFLVTVCMCVGIGGADKGVCESESCRDPKTTERVKSTKELWEMVMKRLERVKASCGELCDLTKTGEPGKYFDFIQKDVNCRALFENKDIDASSEFPSPPARIPKYLKNDFLYNGAAKLIHDYSDDSNGSSHVIEWTKELMDWHFEKFEDRTLVGMYGQNAIDHLEDVFKTKMDLIGKHVLVVGSQRPWLETTLLKVGVGHITTLDYVQINSEHPQISTITPGPFAKAYLSGTLPQYDAVVSYSSVEHSGLGRYGDALNPWGDIIAMARMWCVLKPGGRALVGVPTGPDALLFNLGRVYGPKMYPHLLANWEQVYSRADYDREGDCLHCYQPVHVLEKAAAEVP